LAPERIQLEDSLVLRPATAADAEKVVELNRTVQAEPPSFEPDEGVGHWTRDLFAGVNDRVKPSDFTVVEDTSTGQLVSTMCLISQTWNIGGIDVPMGMPEIVGTHRDYRRRGLVRKQFGMMHRWSEDRGHLFNTIMGIPDYYRQFGYEYAIDAWGGSTTSPALLEPVLGKKDEQPPFTARDADRSDVQFIADTYRTVRDRAFVTVVRDAKIVESELFSTHRDSAMFQQCRVLERSGTPVGYYLFGIYKGNTCIHVDALEIDSSANWFDATTSMLVDLKGMAKRYQPEGKERCEKFELEMGPSHPAFKMYDTALGAPKRAYHWYVRVPDLAKLITHLTPLFESRLARSEFRGWSGAVKISFYTDGIEMKFESGKLTAVTGTGFIERHEASALYPDLTFLKVLFGQHSFTHLKETVGGCYAKDTAMGTLQDILFGGPLTAAVLQVS
jgi:hypothetical protein